MSKKVQEIKGKKLSFISVTKPLVYRSKWTEYDEDLELFADVEMDDFWDVVVPEGMDVKVLRNALRSRIKARFADKIKLASLTEDGELKLQLQKVKK